MNQIIQTTIIQALADLLCMLFAFWLFAPMPFFYLIPLYYGTKIVTFTTLRITGNMR